MNKQTKGEKFVTSAKCKNNHSSPRWNISLCDLNSEGNLLKVHDMCPKPKCKCQKQITSRPNQFQLKRAGFEHSMKDFSGETEKIRNNFNEPGLKKASPIISNAVAAKTNNPQPTEFN